MFQYLLKPKNRTGQWMLGGLIVLTAALFILAQQLVQVWSSTNTLQNKINTLQKRVTDKPVVTLSKAQQEDQKRWAALASEFHYPWQALFHSIEHAGNSNIELLEFKPTKSSRSILLAGEAKTQKSLEEFLMRLEADEMLIAVHLSHQEILLRDRLSTVSFEIKAILY